MAFVLCERANHKRTKCNADDGEHDEQHVEPIVTGEDAKVHVLVV
jgi:hypothetical protein